MTRTALTVDMFSQKELLSKFSERIPMGRDGESDDVAAIVTFLAGHDARFVTATILPVDGGLFASNGQPKQV